MSSASLTSRRPRAAKRQWVGEIEAANEHKAIEKAAKEFKQHASKLIAVNGT